MAEIILTPSSEQAAADPSLLSSGGDAVDFQKNKIDATNLQGAAISWRLVGSGQYGPIVIPANKVSIPMLLEADTFVIYNTGAPMKYKFTAKGKSSVDGGLDDKVQYLSGELVVLSGPGPAPEDPEKEVIDLTGDSSGLNTQWVRQ